MISMLKWGRKKQEEPQSLDDALAEAVRNEMLRQVQVVLNPPQWSKRYDRWALPLLIGGFYIATEVWALVATDRGSIGSLMRQVFLAAFATLLCWRWHQARQEVQRLGELIRYLTEPSDIDVIVDRIVATRVMTTDHPDVERDGWKGITWWSQPDMPDVLKSPDRD